MKKSLKIVRRVCFCSLCILLPRIVYRVWRATSCRASNRGVYDRKSKLAPLCLFYWSRGGEAILELYCFNTEGIRHTAVGPVFTFQFTIITPQCRPSTRVMPSRYCRHVPIRGTEYTKHVSGGVGFGRGVFHLKPFEVIFAWPFVVWMMGVNLPPARIRPWVEEGRVLSVYQRDGLSKLNAGTFSLSLSKLW